MTRLFVLLALASLALIPAGARAQTVQAIGVYQAGWNMAGGPAGTNLSAASYLDAWQNGAYTDTAGRVTSACAGYWAYFVDPAAVPLPVATGPNQACALQHGWNLIGNPFSGNANLPFGTTAYEWKPLAGSYAIVRAIDPGSAVWIYAAQAGSITLTYSPAPTTNVPATLTINAQAGQGPYQVHVGDSVKVIVQSIAPENAIADAGHFTLETSGYQYDLSCTTASCETNPTVQFWIWRATAAGAGTITVNPICTGHDVACIGDAEVIQVTILP